MSSEMTPGCMERVDCVKYLESLNHGRPERPRLLTKQEVLDDLFLVLIRHYTPIQNEHHNGLTKRLLAHCSHSGLGLTWSSVVNSFTCSSKNLIRFSFLTSSCEVSVGLEGTNSKLADVGTMDSKTTKQLEMIASARTGKHVAETND